MIGSHLVAELVRAGYEDIVLPVRNPGKAGAIERAFGLTGTEFDERKIKVIKADITDVAEMTAVFDGVHTVFHCAAVIMSAELDSDAQIKNNIDLARSVADAALAAGVRRIVHTSSIIVLSPKGHGHIVTEENEPHADPDGSTYQRGKYGADLEMKRAQAGGIELVTLYPAVVIGEGDWSMNGSSALIPLISRGLPVYADGVMAYADVRDVARAYVAVDNCPAATGHGFIVAGANISYRQLLDYGARATGRRKPFIRIGKGALYTAYYIMRALIATGLMKERGITKGNLGSVLYGNTYIGGKIEKMCNFEYSPIESTIERVVENYLTEKNKKTDNA